MRFREGEAANVSIHVCAHRRHLGIRLLEAAPKEPPGQCLPHPVSR